MTGPVYSAERRRNIGSALRYPRTIRDMSEVERAWVGSAIDMDGSIVSHTNHGKFTAQWRVMFAGAEVEHIATLLRITGTGKVQYLGISQTSTIVGKKPLWRWSTSTQADFAALISQCSLYSLKCQEAMKEGE